MEKGRVSISGIDYPQAEHIRFISWDDILAENPWQDQYPLEDGGKDRYCVVAGSLQESMELILEKMLGHENWTMDGVGPRGVVVKANPGFVFGDSPVPVPEIRRPEQEEP